MNTKDYKKAWGETPVMRPMFILTKDMVRGNNLYKKGTCVYGYDNRNTFTCPGFGNIGLPLAAVKFIGYEDVRDILPAQFH